jgi:hypothetical protein
MGEKAIAIKRFHNFITDGLERTLTSVPHHGTGTCNR